MLKLYNLVLCLLVVLIFSSSVRGGECDLKGSAKTVYWDYVIDGDTITIKGGDKIRFSSINTPEIEHDGKAAEPYGDQARSFLDALLRASPDKKVLLQINESSTDHYGRTLALPFLPDGRSIEALLIEQGLGIQIMMGKSSPYSACIQQLEQQARTAKRGLWSTRKVLNVKTSSLSGGFQVITGKVVRIKQPKSSQFVWVDLDGPVTLRIHKGHFSEKFLNSMPGKDIETRGWLVERTKKTHFKKYYKHNKHWSMGIYSEDAIHFINKKPSLSVIAD